MFSFTEEEMRLLRALFSLGGISALAAACRLILTKEDERTFLGFMGYFVLGTFAGLMTGLAADGWGVNETMKYAVVSAAALTAKQFLLLMIGCVQMVLDNPKMIIRFLENILPFRRK